MLHGRTSQTALEPFVLGFFSRPLIRSVADSFNVVIAARDETKCMYTAEDCAKLAGRQGAALAIPTDVTSELSVKRLANEVLARYGTIDVVVSNAGVCMTGPFPDTKLDDFKAMMDVNFYVSSQSTKLFPPSCTVAPWRAWPASTGLRHSLPPVWFSVLANLHPFELPVVRNCPQRDDQLVNDFPRGD